jgi:acetyl esterase/lipase
VDLAARLNPPGQTVFVLNCRRPAEGWQARADASLQDARRATRLIRSRARDFRIDPDRVVALGVGATDRP